MEDDTTHYHKWAQLKLYMLLLQDSRCALTVIHPSITTGLESVVWAKHISNTQ